MMGHGATLPPGGESPRLPLLEESVFLWLNLGRGTVRRRCTPPALLLRDLSRLPLPTRAQRARGQVTPVRDGEPEQLHSGCGGPDPFRALCVRFSVCRFPTVSLGPPSVSSTPVSLSPPAHAPPGAPGPPQPPTPPV